MRRRAIRLVNTAIILCVPVAIFALILPSHIYKEQGILGTVDCDGPFLSMLVVLPSAVVFIFATVFYAYNMIKSRKVYLCMFLLMCLTISVCLGQKVIAVYQEKLAPSHLETCGEKW